MGKQPLKTVISASRRTDIPAFYLKWFIKAINKRYLQRTNPFNPSQKRVIDLHHDRVAWIVFWSRNYGPFLRQRAFFDAYDLFFHFTILPPSKMETVSADWRQSLKQMEQLTKYYGPERIIWRYDPLIHWYHAGQLQTNHDPEIFKILAQEMGAMGIKRCYLSFVHPYAKFLKQLKERYPKDRLAELTLKQKFSLLFSLADTAGQEGITLYACCNDELLPSGVIEKGRCIDGHLLNRLAPHKRVSTAAYPSRKQCGCTRSIDIGDYATQPCPYGCLYCYANPQIPPLKTQ